MVVEETFEGFGGAANAEATRNPLRDIDFNAGAGDDGVYRGDHKLDLRLQLRPLLLAQQKDGEFAARQVLLGLSARNGQWSTLSRGSRTEPQRWDPLD